VRHLLEYSTNLVIEGAWTTLNSDIAAVRNRSSSVRSAAQFSAELSVGVFCM
jgi:hypothetical protein